MRKKCLLFFMTICIMGISACGNQDHSPDTTPTMKETICNDEKTEETVQKDEKSWSEQEIVSMFNEMKKTDLEFIDCVVMPDQASRCIGAVLFWNGEQETSNVAFFAAEGYAKQCSTYAKTADEPNFTYLGDGTVTFQLEADDGSVYNYTLTISIDGNNVNFIAADDLPKQQ